MIFLLLGHKFPSPKFPPFPLLLKPTFCFYKTKYPLLFFPPPSETKHFPPPKKSDNQQNYSLILRPSDFHNLFSVWKMWSFRDLLNK